MTVYIRCTEQAEKYCYIKQLLLKLRTKGSDYFSIQYEFFFFNDYIGGELGSYVLSCKSDVAQFLL